VRFPSGKGNNVTDREIEDLIETRVEEAMRFEREARDRVESSLRREINDNESRIYDLERKLDSLERDLDRLASTGTR
jgi:predicted RNase H-like nuclease (RuvC/YqgF family)